MMHELENHQSLVSFAVILHVSSAFMQLIDNTTVGNVKTSAVFTVHYWDFGYYLRGVLLNSTTL